MSTLLFFFFFLLGFSNLAFVEKNNSTSFSHHQMFRYQSKEMQLFQKINALDYRRLSLGLKTFRLQKQVKTLKTKLEEMKEQKKLQQQISLLLVKRIRPRLLLYYRIIRLGKARILLGAKSFQAMAKRWRMLQKLTIFDIQMLKSYQDLSVKMKNTEISMQSTYQTLLRTQKTLEQQEKTLATTRTQLSESLETLLEESQKYKGAIEEMYGSQSKFTALVQQWKNSFQLDGLWHLQGQLQWPIQGFSRYCRQYKLEWQKNSPQLICLKMQFKELSLRDRLERGGIELNVPSGTPVQAIHSGRILFKGKRSGYGNMYIIHHGKRFYSIYAHLLQFGVNVGERVRQSQIIGTVGSSGLHGKARLYFELRYQGRLLNPFDWIQDLSSP